MAFAHVGTDDHAYGAGATIAVNGGGTVAVDTLVVISMSASPDASVAAPAKNSGSSATIGTVFGPVTRAGAALNTQVWVWYCLVTGAGTLTFDIADVGTDDGVTVARFTGAELGGDPIRTSTTSTAESSTTTPTSQSYTPTAGDLEFSSYANESAGNVTAGSGWTESHVDNGHIDQQQYILSSAGGSRTATVTIDASSNAWAMAVLVFKPAAGGGGGSVVPVLDSQYRRRWG